MDTAQFQSPNRDSVSSRSDAAHGGCTGPGFNPLIGILFLHAHTIRLQAGSLWSFNPLIGILFLHACRDGR